MVSYMVVQGYGSNNFILVVGVGGISGFFFTPEAKKLQ